MDKQLVDRITQLEQRVNELEKQLSIIKQMEHSDRVKKYIDNVERARKVTSLLEKMDDVSTESVSVVMDEKVSEELRNEFYLNSLEDAHSYLQTTEMMIAEEEKHLESIVEEKDWSEIFEYQKNQDGIVISRYIGFDEEEIIVPNKIEHIDVVEIGDGAFQNCISIKKVILPNQLKRIGAYAFADCERVKIIDIPNSCEIIGLQAFNNIGIMGANSVNKAQISIRIGNNVRVIEDENNKIGTLFGLGYKFNTRQNITIYCKAGSYAMEYARKHKISVKKYEEFEELD